jgi:hypothetical protein
VRYQGRQVPFLSFALPDSFSTVPRASGPVFIFCALGLFLGGTEGNRSRFHVLRSRIRFRRYRGRRHPFACFALSDPFWAVPRASGPNFMFCAPRLIFGGIEGAGSRFHILCSGTRFGQYRWRRVTFSSFALPDSFSTVPRGSGSFFHFLCSRSLFGRYRGRRVSFSSFALPDSFLTESRVSGPIYMFCAPGLVFDGIEGVGSRFHVLCTLTCFRR